MSYVYDIVLNFNSELYEFYEWKKDDTIYHIKRINLIKVDSKIYNDLLNHKVKFNEDFIISIFNKCEYFDNRSIELMPYAFLVTDSYRVMGLLLDSSGKIIKYSSLLLDEEEYVLDLSDKLKNAFPKFSIIQKRAKNEYNTRQEKLIINVIKKDLKLDYEKKDLNKLKYLYYEYFNKQCDVPDVIYHELMSELDKNLTDKHYNLYNLIKLTYNETIEN